MIICLFSIIFFITTKVCADETEYQLIRMLFQDYDPSIRPSEMHNYTLNVTFGVALTQLIDVVNKKLPLLIKLFVN